MRKTKIIVTIGPSSNNEETLSRLIADGMDCARLNFSHGTHEQHATVIERIRRLAKEHNRTVGILQDLGGIKLRLGYLEEARPVNLGDEVVITADEESHEPGALPFPAARRSAKPSGGQLRLHRRRQRPPGGDRGHPFPRLLPGAEFGSGVVLQGRQPPGSAH